VGQARATHISRTHLAPGVKAVSRVWGPRHPLSPASPGRKEQGAAQPAPRVRTNRPSHAPGRARHARARFETCRCPAVRRPFPPGPPAWQPDKHACKCKRPRPPEAARLRRRSGQCWRARRRGVGGGAPWGGACAPLSAGGSLKTARALSYGARFELQKRTSFLQRL
jgi:hypothetical protein